MAAAAIIHNLYYEGQVQSLGFQSATGRFSVGVVLPGEYDFGVVQTTEVIFVTSGVLQINGQHYCVGQVCTVSAGTPVVICTTVVASYLCQYS